MFLVVNISQAKVFNMWKARCFSRKWFSRCSKREKLKIQSSSIEKPITWLKHKSPYIKTSLSGWWFQPIWKILVKMGIFPNFRGENKKCLKPPPSYLLHTFLILPKKKRDPPNFFALSQTFMSGVTHIATISKSPRLWTPKEWGAHTWCTTPMATKHPSRICHRISGTSSWKISSVWRNPW